MPRVKRGVTAKARHKKVLTQAKGYRGRRNAVYRIAKEAVMKAGQYAYRDRRVKKREFRALWIARINHALTAVALAVLGILAALGPIYWIGWLVVVGLLIYEHSLVSPRDLSRLDVAFFNINGYIALIVLAAVVLGLR